MARAGIQTQLHCIQQGVPPKPPPVLDLDRGTHIGILVALATGDRSGVSKDTWSLLRRTGTAHLLAISGFHIGLVAWFGYLLGQALARLYVFIDERGLPSFWVFGFSVLVAWGYALGAGLPVSAQRAAMMVTLVASAKALDRQIPVGNLLGLAGIAVLGFDPSAIASPGFQLSFMAVVGLVRVTPWVTERLGNPTGWKSWGVKGFAATVGATVGTLPVAGWWFQEIAPWSPLANLIALPWVAWVVVPCAFGAVWLPGVLSDWALAGGEWGMSTLVWVLSMLNSPPIVFALGPWGCLLGVVLCLLPSRFAVVLLFLAQLSLERPMTGMTLTLLDVGHGEAIVVEWPERKVWLVDGGPPGRSVLQYLRRQGHGRLDVVALTHGHTDHAGGLWAVVEQMPIQTLWFGPSWDERIAQMAREREIPVVVEPELSLPSEGGSDNDQSLVLPIHWGPFSVLLTGDVEHQRERSLMKQFAKPVDVLKVAHHGSKTSSSPEVLDTLQPRIALISASGAYGLPHPDVLERYRSRGIRVLRTDTLGTIQLRFEEQHITAWHHRAGKGWRRLPMVSSRETRLLNTF